MTSPEASNDVAVSVVVPVYNEELSLYELRDELFPVLEAVGEPFEVLFVDDGSTDRSTEILREFHRCDSRVTVIRFVRNFGQQWALTAGLCYARGAAVIIMDADLQQSAAYIPAFLARLREGYDIVFGRRVRLTGPWYRRVGTRVANVLLRNLTGIPVRDGASNYMALDEKLVKRVNLYQDKSRYLKSLFAWLSYGRYGEVEVVNRERKYGRSKYRLFQLVGMVLALIVGLSVRPLALTAYAGGGVIGLSLLAGLRWLYVLVSQGWGAAEIALFTAVIMFVGGIQLFALGILGEYIGRIYGEVRERPPYVISEVYERRTRMKGEG